MPQHEVANGKGQIEFFLASPTTFSSFVAKKPSPSKPSGASAMATLSYIFASFGYILKRTGRAIFKNFACESKYQMFHFFLYKVRTYIAITLYI